ncbi:DUF359 domain-containing protein, partial [Vibrio parahaemolyticus]|uniref:DUF359 domain-containing protein n=1 Tax=Vibrio parahaemolyticus TaxID=670 RepID=UPI0011200821
ELSYFHALLNAANPPGTITEELLDAIIKAYEINKTGNKVLIVVDGEEDLAVLPCVITAPPGTVVLYGQPGEGV